MSKNKDENKYIRLNFIDVVAFFFLFILVLVCWIADIVSDFIFCIRRIFKGKR